MYVVYNGQILADPDAYGYDVLYVKADVLFCVSAIFYLLGSMRDCGFFTWLPLAGCRSLAQLDEDDEDDTTVSATSGASNSPTKGYGATMA